jgi:hypothetical protein
MVAVRGVIGAAAWFAPRLSGRVLGLDPGRNPEVAYLARLFAVRDAALGFGLGTSDEAGRAQWLRAGIACDFGDAVAGVLAGRRGELPKPATVMVTGAALAAVTLGFLALRGEQPAT